MKTNYYQHSKGISIVELLISIALGTLIIGSVIEVYLNNKATYRMQEGFARIQENGRYSDFLFNRTLRMAGFQGCNHEQIITVNNLVTAPSVEITFTQPVAGHEGAGGNWTPALPASLAGNVLANTDAVIVRNASNLYSHLTAAMSTQNQAVAINNRLGAQDDDILFITDCEVADIFKASDGTTATSLLHTTADNTSNNLSKAYQVDAQVMLFQYYAYYVKDTGRVNASGAPIYSLYQMDVTGTEREMVEGVENMQITYGVDSDNDGAADSYSTASAVNAANNWPQVVTMKISLLLNSIDNVTRTSEAYSFLGAVTTPNDRILRRQWDSFIQLRNRSL